VVRRLIVGLQRVSVAGKCVESLCLHSCARCLFLVRIPTRQTLIYLCSNLVCVPYESICCILSVAIMLLYLLCVYHYGNLSFNNNNNNDDDETFTVGNRTTCTIYTLKHEVAAALYTLETRFVTDI
jgi:hypothetical protein